MPTKEALQKQIDDLKNENVALKTNKSTGLPPIQDRLLEEMNLLKSKSVVSDKISMKIIDDHKNIALYHTNGFQIGKIVGPLHPHNARVEMERFARRGIILSTNEPSEEQKNAYYATDEYKRLKKAFDAGRARKVKSRGKEGFDKVVKAIEKLCDGNKIVNSLADAPVG